MHFPLSRLSVLSALVLLACNSLLRAEIPTSRNLVPNSSFEIVSDSMPDWWSATPDAVEQYGSLEAWRPHWGLDEKERVHGTRCLRMDGGFS